VRRPKTQSATVIDRRYRKGGSASPRAMLNLQRSCIYSSPTDSETTALPGLDWREEFRREHPHLNPLPLKGEEMYAGASGLKVPESSSRGE
jgi:hypothetical protein